jgi:hypothetical protein
MSVEPSHPSPLARLIARKDLSDAEVTALLAAMVLLAPVAPRAALVPMARTVSPASLVVMAATLVFYWIAAAGYDPQRGLIKSARGG